MNAVFQTNKVVRVILKSNGWRVFCKVIVHTDENWDMNRYDIHTPTFKSTAEIAGKPEWVDSIGEVYKDKKLSTSSYNHRDISTIHWRNKIKKTTQRNVPKGEK